MIPLEQAVEDYAFLTKPDFDRKYQSHYFVWQKHATLEDETDPHGPTINIKTRTPSPSRGYTSKKDSSTKIIPIVRREGSVMAIITIGRLHTDTKLHTMDIIFTGDHVSKFHASLGTIGTDLLLTDKGSMNGTYVNHTKLEANRPYKLADKDLIHIGGPRSDIELTYHTPSGLRAYLETFVTKSERPSA